MKKKLILSILCISLLSCSNVKAISYAKLWLFGLTAITVSGISHLIKDTAVITSGLSKWASNESSVFLNKKNKPVAQKIEDGVKSGASNTYNWISNNKIFVSSVAAGFLVVNCVMPAMFNLLYGSVKS